MSQGQVITHIILKGTVHESKASYSSAPELGPPLSFDQWVLEPTTLFSCLLALQFSISLGLTNRIYRAFITCLVLLYPHQFCVTTPSHFKFLFIFRYCLLQLKQFPQTHSPLPNHTNHHCQPRRPHHIRGSLQMLYLQYFHCLYQSMLLVTHTNCSCTTYIYVVDQGLHRLSYWILPQLLPIQTFPMCSNILPTS